MSHFVSTQFFFTHFINYCSTVLVHTLNKLTCGTETRLIHSIWDAMFPGDCDFLLRLPEKDVPYDDQLAVGILLVANAQ